MMRLISSVGKLTAVSTNNMVIKPALGTLAAPILANVAVRLENREQDMFYFTGVISMIRFLQGASSLQQGLSTLQYFERPHESNFTLFYTNMVHRKIFKHQVGIILDVYLNISADVWQANMDTWRQTLEV